MAIFTISTSYYSYDSPLSGTYPTIGDAIAAALPGDTIVLGDGYGPETVTITQNDITISGTLSSLGIELLIADGVSGLVLIGDAPINVTGSLGANVIAGNDSDNVMTSTSGIDVFDGGLGIDRLVVDYSLNCKQNAGAGMSWSKSIFGGERQEPKSTSGTTPALVSSISLSKTDQLEIASLFIKATYPSTHARPCWDYMWRAKIGVSLPQVVEIFCHTGLLREANSAELLEGQFTLSKLKELAKAKGLKVSGKKSELAQQLSEAGVDMSAIKKDETLFICTDFALSLVTSYKDKKLQAHKDAQSATLKFLKDGKLKEAFALVVAYEKDQYYPRGIGVDLSNASGLMYQDLMTVSSAQPKLHARRFGELLFEIRERAAMSVLWGTKAFRDLFPKAELLEQAEQIELSTRMLTFYSNHQRNLKQFQDAEAHGLEMQYVILVADDQNTTCEACLGDKGQTYRLKDLPELPHEYCQCAIGCHCGALLHKACDNRGSPFPRRIHPTASVTGMPRAV
jgi:hypothetical protein